MHCHIDYKFIEMEWMRCYPMFAPSNSKILRSYSESTMHQLCINFIVCVLKNQKLEKKFQEFFTKFEQKKKKKKNTVIILNEILNCDNYFETVQNKFC